MTLKHYIMKSGDECFIEEEFCQNYHGNRFFVVNKSSNGVYSFCKSGSNFKLAPDILKAIRIDGKWYKFIATYCEMNDLDTYGDVTYDVECLEETA